MTKNICIRQHKDITKTQPGHEHLAERKGNTSQILDFMLPQPIVSSDHKCFRKKNMFRNAMGYIENA